MVVPVAETKQVPGNGTKQRVEDFTVPERKLGGNKFRYQLLYYV
jgi:hypothetical protein